MADYTPVYIPSRVISVTVSAPVEGGDILVVSGNGTAVKCPAEAAVNHIGVAAGDTAANERCSVYGRGYVHESVADGTVTAGDQLVTSATAGRQVKTLAAAAGTPAAADVNNARAVIGVALTTAADGATVRWMEF